MEGNSSRQPQDIKDEDEEFYQRQVISGVDSFVKAWWKTRLGVEGNQFPNPRT
jgi:hypothetical protein